MRTQTQTFTKPVQVLVIFALILILVIPLLIPPTVDAGPKIQPQLLQIVEEDPGQTVRIIVQKTKNSQVAEALTVQLGGEIVADLSMIHAFATEMAAGDALQLARSGTVRWVSLDAPVESAGKPPPKDSSPNTSGVSRQTLVDDFNQVSFDNNDGTKTWATSWLEVDAFGSGASGGNVWVEDGGLRIGGGTDQSAAREADLGHAMDGASLVYTFSFGPAVQSGTDRVVLEVSKNGGLTYDSIITFSSYDGGEGGTFYGGLTDYISSNTIIRYRILAGYDRPGAYFSVDTIEVGYDANPLSVGPAYNNYLDTLNVTEVWDMGYDGNGIGVAVIDSGINKEAGFERRIKKQISFNANSSTVNDTFGHGTHVAGIIGGADLEYDGRFTGIAPGVNLLSLKINDETGMAYESDLVAAMQWVYDYKDRYNIRVVNLSVNSTVEGSYHDSPVNAAAEILWFNGIVVVTSAGNKSDGLGFNPVLAAPANDPFLITVGAAKERGTPDRSDDVRAFFSAGGTTHDGYRKPEIFAPGKNIISVLSGASSWYADDTRRVVLEKYYRISGTSMAAPMVTGAVALLLQAEPDLTPDQVKYRLMNTAGDVGDTQIGYMDVFAMVTTPTTESANTGLEASQLLWTGNEPVVWGSVAWNSVAWNSVAWNSVAWNSVAWNSVAWNSVAWNE